jgi:hypothetical protein
MIGQENSLVHADRGNGVVPGSPESLQELLGFSLNATDSSGPAVSSNQLAPMGRNAPALKRAVQRGIRQPTKRDFCRDHKDQLLRTLLPSETRVPNASVTPVEGCGVDPLFRKHRSPRLHLEEIMP